MSLGFTIFCFITATIIVVTKVILEIMEEKDIRNGIMVDHNEYKIRHLLKLVFQDIKDSFKRSNKPKTNKKMNKKKNKKE